MRMIVHELGIQDCSVVEMAGEIAMEIRMADHLRGSADRHAGLVAPQPTHYSVGVVVHAVHTKPGSRHRAWLPISLLRQTRFALEFCCPPSPCPACLDERLPDPTCLSAEPLMSNQMGE